MNVWDMVKRNLAWVGVAIVAVALVFSWLTLGNILHTLKLALLLALLAGVAIFGARFQAIYARVGLVLLNTLLVLLLIEGLSIVALGLSTLHSPENENLSIPYYQSQDWSEDYWVREPQKPRLYQPYTIWRSQAYTNPTLNINEEGIRATPAADCANPDAYRVFMMGGSTMWGIGSPDWGTIPNLFAEALAQPVCIINYGEHAYVSTQSIITLMRELQAGHIPDLVISYDGVNDVFAAAQSGQAGVHQNLFAVEAQYNTGALTTAQRLVSASALANALLVVASNQTNVDSTATIDNIETLADEVILAYSQNVRMVASMAEEFGFEYAFFWQPMLYIGEKPLTDREQRYIDDGFSPDIIRLFEQSYARMEDVTRQPFNVFDISDVFDGVETQLYIDLFHVTPEGNALVVAAMLEHLEIE